MAFQLQFVCLLIDVNHSKFEPRNVSHRGAARRAHCGHHGNIVCEHLSATLICSFLHRWQINLHEQSWRCTFHTTEERFTHK